MTNLQISNNIVLPTFQRKDTLKAQLRYHADNIASAVLEMFEYQSTDITRGDELNQDAVEDLHFTLYNEIFKVVKANPALAKQKRIGLRIAVLTAESFENLTGTTLEEFFENLSGDAQFAHPESVDYADIGLADLDTFIKTCF